jgi:hypothetical protein
MCGAPPPRTPAPHSVTAEEAEEARSATPEGALRRCAEVVRRARRAAAACAAGGPQRGEGGEPPSGEPARASAARPATAAHRDARGAPGCPHVARPRGRGAGVRARAGARGAAAAAAAAPCVCAGAELAFSPGPARAAAVAAGREIRAFHVLLAIWNPAVFWHVSTHHFETGQMCSAGVDAPPDHWPKAVRAARVSRE